MDEQQYLHLADAAFRRIEDGLADCDADEIDCERAGDVLTLTFKGGVRCVVNTQRPVRQMWMAAKGSAWHFSYDAAAQHWIDDKRPDGELFRILTTIVKEQSGRDVRF